MKRADCFPARLEALKTADRVRRSQLTTGCIVYMKDFIWLVPPAQRPKLAPPPREMSEAERKADKWLCAFNGIRM